MSANLVSPARFLINMSEPGRRMSRSWEFAVGCGDAWSILRADLQQQLRRAVRECGFRYLRCHGILCDQLQAVRRDRQDNLIYNWQLVDAVCDALLEIGLRPFVELGFMPTALASGEQTVFFYRANVTPPADYEAWNAFIAALVAHWRARYGAEELRQWYFEVWNEANLPSFWSSTQEEYFRLYAETVRAIKAIDPALRVGGPATTRGEWLPEFLTWCREHDVPADFVSTHVYPDDDDFAMVDPDYRDIFNRGDYLEALVGRAAEGLADERPIGGDGRLEAHWTEWNSSWRWGRPIHDVTNQAAYICRAVHGVHERVDSFAFWTISDIFNEFPYPRATFVGGFGLITNDGLPKPGYHAYTLLHRLGDTEVPAMRQEGDAADTQLGRLDCWAARGTGASQILLSNYVPPALDGARLPPRDVVAQLTGLPPDSRWRLTEYRIDAEHANPLVAWEALGRPESPSRAQLADLRAAAELRPADARTVQADGGGEVSLTATLLPGSVTFYELSDAAQPT
jgi:xylan 1,4-beta-xylosidase